MTKVSLYPTKRPIKSNPKRKVWQLRWVGTDGGVPTNDEQQLELQRDAIGASKSSARAAWMSAGCAIVAVIISVLALWAALQD